MKKTADFRLLSFLLAFIMLVGLFVPAAAAPKAKLNVTKKTIYVGSKTKLSVKGASGKVTWSSSKKGVAAVDKKGNVTAKKAGSAKISAKVSGLKKALSCKITVLDPYFTQSGKKITAVNIARAASNKTAAVNIVGTKVKTVKSAKTSVATVKASGTKITVTAKKAGSSKITVAATNKKSYSFTVNVTQLMTGLELTAASEFEAVIGGEDLVISPQITPADTTNKALTWTSSDTSIATVTNGVVCAVSAGVVEITAAANDGSKKSATCSVLVKQPVTAMEINAEKSEILVGETTTFTAVPTPDNAFDKTVTWTSGDETIATVDANGVVTGVAPGSAAITATANDGSGVTDTKLVTVIRLAQSVTIAGDNSDLDVGTTVSLTATVAPDDTSDKSVTWSSSDDTIATVDADGVVTGVAPGDVVITAKTNDGTKLTDTFSLKVVYLVKQISFDTDEINLITGKSAQINATVAPENATNSELAWSSDTPAVADVENGVVTAKSAGTAVITASAKDNSGVTKTITVTVTQAVTEINFNRTSATISIEEGNNELELLATVLPNDAANKTLLWTSSDDTKAQVDSSGKITAVAPGRVEIRATATDGSEVYCVCDLTIEDPNAEGVYQVKNQQELNEALSAQEPAKEIIVDSQEGMSVPQGDYVSTTLTVKKLASRFINGANFLKVVLNDESGNTFEEQAVGNNIEVQNPSDEIYIAQEARSSIDIVSANQGSGDPESGIHYSTGAQESKLRITNYGTISGIKVDTPVAIEIKGAATSRKIPVEITPQAEGTEIETSQNLKLELDAPISLTLNEGAEESTAQISHEDNIPIVKGLGQVMVTNTATTDVDTIVAENISESSSYEAVSVMGRVLDSNGNGMSGVKVYVIPYSRDFDTDDLSSVDDYVVTDSEGSYTVSDVRLGNYYLICAKDGFINNVQTLSVLSTYLAAGTFNNEDVILVTDEEGTGNIAGILKDALTGDAITYSVRLKIREGQNNISGSALSDIIVNADSYGSYSFNSLDTGTYTIEVLSDTYNYEHTRIMNTYFTVTVSRDDTANGNFTITRITDENQVRFVLTWGDQASGAPSDLDSHLTGPAYDSYGSDFHVYYSNKTYYSYADLDVDDVSWEGPETTTIYELSSGIYSFYIHNYTNKEDTNSYELSNRSSAVVKVYQGDVLRATYYVPTGRVGTLWHVCDFDADSGMLTPYSTIINWSNAHTVGVNMIGQFKNTLKKSIDEAAELISEIANEETKKAVEDAISEAESVYENASSIDTIDTIESAVNKLNSTIQSIKNAVAIDYIKYIAYEEEGYTEYKYISYTLNGSVITTTDANVLTKELIVTPVSASSKVTVEDVENEDYFKIITVSNEEIGISKTYKMYFRVNWNYLEVGLNYEDMDFMTYRTSTTDEAGRIDVVCDNADISKFRPFSRYAQQLTEIIPAGEDDEFDGKVIVTYGNVRYTYYVYLNDIRTDSVELTDGQTYSFVPNNDGAVKAFKFTADKSGEYIITHKIVHYSYNGYFYKETENGFSYVEPYRSYYTYENNYDYYNWCARPAAGETYYFIFPTYNHGEAEYSISFRYSTEFAKNELQAALASADECMRYLSDGEFKDNFANTVNDANSALEENSFEKMVESASILRLLNEQIYNSIYFNSLYYTTLVSEGDEQYTERHYIDYDYYNNRTDVSIYNLNAYGKELGVNLLNPSSVAEFKDAENEEYFKTLTVKNDSIGASKTYYLHLVVYTSTVAEIRNVTGDGVVCYSSSYYSSSSDEAGILSVYGYNMDTNSVTVHPRYEAINVEYVENTDPEKDYNATVTLSFLNRSKKYNVYLIDVAGNTIELNTQKLVSSSEVFSFTAETAGYYTIYSQNCRDAYVYVYKYTEENGWQYHGYNDDWNGLNFRYEFYAQSGDQFVFKTQEYSFAEFSSDYRYSVYLTPESSYYNESEYEY